MAGGQPFDAPLTAAKVHNRQKRRLGVLSPPGRRSTHCFDRLVPRRWARFAASRDFDTQLTARRLVAPGMRKRTREGMRSPGYQTFCSHPEASGVLTRITMGLKLRPYSAVQTPYLVVLTTRARGVVPTYSPLSSTTRPGGQLRMSIVLTASATLTSRSGVVAQEVTRRAKRRIVRGMEKSEQMRTRQRSSLCVIKLHPQRRTARPL